MKKSSLFILAISLLFASCSTIHFDMTGNILNKSSLADDELIESGNIYFAQKRGAFGSFIYGSSVDKPANLKKNDFFISGMRTKSDDSGTIILSGENAISDRIQSLEGYEYRWEGTVEENNGSVPIIYEFYVLGTSHKEFQLISGHYDAPLPSNKKEKIKAFIFESVPEGGAKLSMNHRINGDSEKIPFEVASFCSKNGTEFLVNVTRDYEYKPRGTGKFKDEPEENLWRYFNAKVEKREAIFDKKQVFQITDKENKILFAECSVNDYKLFKPAEEKSEDVKECIKSFIGYLWALDEHNQTSERLK